MKIFWEVPLPLTETLFLKILILMLLTQSSVLCYHRIGYKQKTLPSVEVFPPFSS